MDLRLAYDEQCERSVAMTRSLRTAARFNKRALLQELIFMGGGAGATQLKEMASHESALVRPWPSNEPLAKVIDLDLSGLVLSGLVLSGLVLSWCGVARHHGLFA